MEKTATRTGIIVGIVSIIALIGVRHPEFPPLPDISGKRSAHGCTSFILDNGGDPVFGTNYDQDFGTGYLFVNKRGMIKYGWEPGGTGRFATWTSRYGSLTFNIIGYQMPWGGMNEAGLVISTMHLEETKAPDPDERPPLAPPLWVQYLLDTCSTIKDVLGRIPAVRNKDTTEHYLVCDRRGNAAVIEFIGGKTVIYTGKNLPVKALANNSYAESLEYLTSGDVGYAHPNNTFSRFHDAAVRTGEFRTAGSTGAVMYAFDTLTLVTQYNTNWSIVFDPANGRIAFRTASNSDIRTIDFRKLDFSCESPVRMFDITKINISGDISDRLEPYSHDKNHNQIVKSLESFTPSVTGTQIALLQFLFESYPCVNPAKDLKRLFFMPRILLFCVIIVMMIATAVLVSLHIRNRRKSRDMR